MRKHAFLGEFELMILLTILQLGDEAYGISLARELAVQRGREVHLGSVYAALERLEIHGLATSSLGEATRERGGRAKRYFHVTEHGLHSLHASREVLRKLWRWLPAFAGESA